MPQDNAKGKFAAPRPKNRILVRTNKWLVPGMAQSNKLEGGGTDKVRSGPVMKKRNRITVKPAQTHNTNGVYATYALADRSKESEPQRKF